MNSNTLNTLDAIRFRLDAATGETNNLNSHPNHTPSQRRDEQISGGVRSKEESERRNDATGDVNLPANGNLDAMEEDDAAKATGPRSLVPNARRGSHDVIASFTDAIPQTLKKPAPPSTTQGSISTIRPIEHTRNKKHAPHTLTRETKLTTSTSINISQNRSRFLQSTSQHGQAGPTGPSSKPYTSLINATALALNTWKTAARIQEETILNQMKQMNAESSTPHSSVLGHFNLNSTRTGKSTVASSAVGPKPDTASAPLLAGTMPKVVPNTALGPRRIEFLASDTSKLTTLFRDTTKNKASNALQKTTPVVTQNLDHPLSPHIPPSAPRHPIHFSPKPSSHSIPHSPINSPSYSNANQETPLFVPSSPTIPINPSLKDPNSEDGFTSADAEGESVGCDSLYEFIESSVVDTQAIQPIKTNSTILQSSKQSSHKSVYDLFTPPLTRQSSEVPSQLAEHEFKYREAPRFRLIMSYVKVPPLPKGVTKLEYRPLKRAKRTHGDTEYVPESTSRDSWGKEMYRGIKGRTRDVRRQSSTRTVRSPSVLSLATTASSYVARGRQAGRSKTVFSKPPARTAMKTSGQASAIEGDINVTASASTAYHSPFQPPPPPPSFQNPSSFELGIQNHRVRDAEHLSPVVTYFNARHYRLCPEEDMTSWILLGAQILVQCLRPRMLSCVREMELNNDEEIGEVDYRVGGPVSWEGCPDRGEEEPSVSRLQSRRAKIPIISGLDVRQPKSSVVVQKKPSETPCVTQSLETSVPRVDLTEVLREKTSTMTSPRKLKRDVKKGRPAESPDITAPAVSQVQSQHQPKSPAAVEQQPKSRPYLSEKARGKQKAVDTDFVEPDFHGDLRSVTALSPTTTQGLLDVDTLSPTTDSLAWSRSVEQYITFDGSPTKLGGGSSTADDGYVPNFAYAPYDTNQFLSSRANMDDIFLPPHNGEPSIFNDGTNLMEGIDAYHDPYGVSMNVEKEVQPTTIDPTLLGGDNFDHATDEVGLTFGVTSLMDDTDSAEIEDQKLHGVAVHGEQLLGTKTGFAPILGSPIVSAARSFSSSSNVSPRSSQQPSTPVHSRSISATLLGRTSSPEFSDYNVPSSVRILLERETPRSIKRARTAASLSLRDIFDGSEDEEEEVRRGLEYLDAFTTSDEDFIPRSDLENESEDVDRARPASLRTKRKFSVSSSAASTPAVAKSFGRSQDWECGPIRSCCHYCRTSSNKLKMVCACGSRYCNRCLALRFPDIEFRSKWDGYECPSCKDRCTCDVCTRKRGEVYVPRRRNPEHLLQTTPAISRPKRTVQSTVQTSSLPQQVSLPSPEAVVNTESFSFWGSIYDMNGSKIAVGFADEGNEVVVANAVEGYARPKVAESVSVSEDDLPASRMFVGAYQSSWGLGSSPIIKDLRGRGRRRRFNDEDVDGTQLRWYIGKESLLYRSVAVRTRDLPTNLFSDMSSLSSLSDDSDVEVDDNAFISVVDKTSTIHFVEGTKDEKKSISNVDPNAIQARDTVQMLQLIGRDICGMMGNVEQSLTNT